MKLQHETFKPLRRFVASAAEPRGGRRVRGRAERHAALAITSKTRFWYNI
jgi:hypothetical protein